MEANAQTAEKKTEVNDIEIIIDGSISKHEILNQLVTLETPWGFWIFLNEEIYQKIGAPREYFDVNLFNQDISHLKDYLYDNGYFQSQIDTALTFTDDRKYVDISVRLTENKRSVIDTVKILGLEEIPPDVANDISQRTVLKVGDQYAKKDVVEAQSIILRTLMNAGYPKAFLDTLSLLRYASTNNVSVMLKFNPGKRYFFGDVRIDRVDAGIDSVVMFRQLDFSRGEVFNEGKRLASEQNLNRLGVFEFASVRQQHADDSQLTDTVPMLISYRMIELQEITPEVLLLNENSTFLSTGLGVSYKHRNLFGGAQNFSVSSSARANRIEDLNYGGAIIKGLAEPTLYGKANVQTQLAFPYFFSNKTSAAITLTAEAEKQPEYDLNTLRGKISFSTKLATYTIGITEFNVERVDPNYRTDKTQGIRADDSTKQFNVIESYTLQRDKTNSFFSPTSGFFHSVSIEEAGVVNVLAGGFNLPYSEYYKITLLLKHYFSAEDDQRNVYAFKIKTGLAQLYNPKNTTPVPLPRRFFVGGSNSVRAWKDRQLSAFGDTLKGGNVAIDGSIESRSQMFPNGGKIFNVVELPRFWSVLFLDYGNTWYSYSDISLKDVALAVGFGLRYETFVGPFRLDIAWRLYDPKKSTGQQWLTEQSFLQNSFSIVHFGIGHAF
jgi:outer membrane protein assembly factor BamA